MLYKLCRPLASSRIFFYLLFWLMILLVAGTLAEQQSGLYYAQKNYFSVYFFLLFGFLPLPGTYTTLTVIFINLLCKLMTDQWSVKRLGSLVTHLSGLALLIGGFLSAHYSAEGYLDLKSSQFTNYFSDYNKTELLINSNHLNIVFEHDRLVPNSTLTDDHLPVKILVTDYCEHCKVVTHQDGTEHLEKLPKPKDNEEKKPILGVTFQNTSLPNAKIIYLINNNNQAYPLTVSDQHYNIWFRHQRSYLPFNLKLENFKPVMHPGTEIAKSYESDVIIEDPAYHKQWQAKISMNNPLRYKGYTFYQASYYVEEDAYTSVLAAVYNVGQSFPYIASILLCIGILLHLFQRIPKLLSSQTKVKYGK